jgi:hypothetical protein
MKRRSHALVRVVLAVGVSLTGALVGALIVSSTASSTEKILPATESFGVFASGSAELSEPELADLAEFVGASENEFRAIRVLGRQLGRFDSRLVAFPARGGGTVCYALLGGTPEDPAMSYCYQPRNRAVPRELRNQHFHALALQSVIDGKVGVQLFGVAEDEVASVRVSIGGSWRNVPVSSNGFYLDLPGVWHRDVGIVEATMRDGSTHVHDIQKGR